jgi:exonuclease 3'-5' domain-containing protein 1
VDTFEKLDEFLSHLVDLPANTLETPELAMDCEGRDLGRFGSLTLLQIFLRFLAHTFVLDILILEGRRAFDYKHKNGWSVRRLLESDILKIMWDPRQDQDALKAHFDIELGWTMCLQLVELVVRNRGRDREKRAKLMNCIDLEGGAWMSFEEVDKWVAANVAGRRFFRQYTYGVFEQRPMPSIALEYAAGDVDQMLKLWDHFYPRLTIEGKELVAMETKKCLMESMLEDKPEGSAFAPQSIQDLPIIPFVFPVYVPEEPEESPNDADEDDTSSEKSEYGLGEEEPEWQKNSMKHVDYDWSKTVLPGEVKNSWASTK